MMLTERFSGRFFLGRLPIVCAMLAFSVAGSVALAQQRSSVIRPATMRPIVGQPSTLMLRDGGVGAVESNLRFSDRNIGHAIVREIDGSQRSIIDDLAKASPQGASLTFDQGGPVLVCIGMGNAADRDKSDAWRRINHCVKLILDVQGEGQADAVNPGMIAKTGHRIEILPLADPTRIGVGDDLPVRVYYEGVKVAGATVTADVFPDGFDGPSQAVTAASPTDSHGITRFPVGQAGIWVLRFEHVPEGPATTEGPFIAELIFEVRKGGQS